MLTHKKTIILSLLSSLLLSNVYANTIELEEITVEAANRTGQNIKDLTESVQIITEQEIEESRVSTLSEALSRLGNIAMSANGGPGQPTSMLVRGFDSKRVLVLIDGARINDVTGLNGAQFEHISLDNVAQIEIIKGAQSGIWGADASAGVINIVTKKAKEGTHASTTLEYGSFATKRASAQVTHKQGNLDIALGASRYDTHGISAAEPTHTNPNYGERWDDLGWEDDAYVNKTYNLKLGYDITENDRVEASFRYVDAYTEYDAAAGVDADNYADPFGFGVFPYFNEINNYFYTAAYKHKNEVNDITLQYNYSKFKRSQYDGYQGKVEEISLQDKIDYAQDSFLRVGGSYQRFEQEQSAGANLNKKYNDKALYLSNYNKFSLLEGFGNTIFTQALRFDNYSEMDNKTTGKVGFKQFLHNDIYLSSNYGTAYNIPTLYQLYDGFAGNPNLTPETTKSFEVSIGNDELILTYFYNKIDDLIDYVPVGFSGDFQNIEGTSHIKGVEASYNDYFFDTFSLNLNYTYLDAKDSDGNFLARRPKHQVDGNIYYYFNDSLSIALLGQYIGERYDRINRQGAQTGRYTLFHTVINYTLNKNFTFYLKVDNLTDKYYQVVDGYATAERSYYAGLTAKF